MTALINHASGDSCKLLLIGNSGAGKTGSTAALVKDGYRLIFADFDNGLPILRNTLKKAGLTEQMKTQVFAKSFADDMEWKGTGLVPKQARAFQESMKAITGKWVEDDGQDLGNIYSWGPETVLVVDSLTRVGRCAMHMVLSLNNRLADGPTQSDWGDAQNEVENFIALITSPSVKCNVILMAHIDQADDPVTGGKRLFPMTLGQKLPPKVATYFNTMLLAKTKGLGDATKRIIRTTSEGTLEIKYPMPSGALPAELPIETALSTFFKAMRDNDKDTTK